MKVVILVPRRADLDRRDRIWQWVRDRWETEQPSWPIFEGHHDVAEGAFNRSMAINRAADQAGLWDIGIIADSDSFVGQSQIEAAVETCARTGQMTLAYDKFSYLSRSMSDAIMSGFTGNWWDGVEWYLPGSCSSMVVVTREVWDQAEGFDEGFTGWGGEDIGFSHKAQTFGGGLQRIKGDVWHLHHPTAIHADNSLWVPRCERYALASYDVDKMRALMADLKAESVAA